MDISRYSPEIQALHAEYESRVGRSDASAVRVLGKLKKIAMDKGDDLLLGHIYHCYAFAEYFVRGKYDAFLKYLRMSSRCLMRSEDETEFAHVYYLIALDAMNKGLYDIACSDFLQARALFAAAGNETSAAIMDLSIGHVLQMLYDYGNARFYMRRALKGVRKNKNHPHYVSNTASLYMNVGICELGLGHLDQAERACQKAAAFMKQHEGQFQKGTIYDYLLLRTHLYLAQGEKEKMRESFLLLLAQTSALAQTVNYIEEIRKLAVMMIECGEHELVGKLLEVLNESVIPEKATNARRILVDIQVSYYLVAKDREGLEKAYRMQKTIHRRLIEEQKKFYRHALGLIRLVGELRDELEFTRSEHESLLYLAQTDTLCGIPNRLSLTEHLNQAFEHAYHNKRSLGVCMIDVNGLKAYNDAHGHTEGDHRLAELGALLQSFSQDSRIFAARYGGDEFVIVYENMSDDEISRHIDEIEQKAPLRISYGLYNRIPNDTIRIWDYMKRADASMYMAKKNARREQT